jgi:ABC-type molybdate transport system substrate-binding protein
VWEKVQPNVAMVVGCIPELANAVAMKGADAGILWDACVQQVADHVDALPIPAKYNEVAEVRIATLRFSAAPEEAQSFADFAASPEVAAIFEREGFRTTPPAGIRMAPEEGPAK